MFSNNEKFKILLLKCFQIFASALIPVSELLQTRFELLYRLVTHPTPEKSTPSSEVNQSTANGKMTNLKSSTFRYGIWLIAIIVVGKYTFTS